MSTAKQLAEQALRVVNILTTLPVHEQAAVLAMAGQLLAAAAKNAEQSVMNAQPMSTLVGDQHFREQ